MRVILINKTLYQELYAVTKWCNSIPDNTPHFYPGDRFFENAYEFQCSCIPDEELNENEFLSYFEYDNDTDEIIGYIGNDNLPEDEQPIRPVKIQPQNT